MSEVYRHLASFSSSGKKVANFLLPFCPCISGYRRQSIRSGQEGIRSLIAVFRIQRAADACRHCGVGCRSSSCAVLSRHLPNLHDLDLRWLHEDLLFVATGEVCNDIRLFYLSSGNVRLAKVQPCPAIRKPMSLLLVQGPTPASNSL